MTGKMNADTLKVLLVRSGQEAVETEVEDTLKAKQEMVGGWIEMIMPFDDEAAIICNEEGKILGLPMNRALRNEEGKVIDIVCGDFFICYAPRDSEDFLSLPPEMMQKYKEKFRYPERFYIVDNEIYPVKYHPSKEEMER